VKTTLSSVTVGVDEAGRGALAGPVVAAAVILGDDFPIDLVKDSKMLTPKKRDVAFDLIQEKALQIEVGVIDHAIVDQINVLKATMLAMKWAVQAISIVPKAQWNVLIDGNKTPDIADVKMEAIVQGDKKVAEISAASIIAKVTRDRMMIDFHEKYPEYGFDVHKGYGTKIHYEALEKYGPSDIHRLSFRLR
jgi:ribonuclease HII